MSNALIDVRENVFNNAHHFFRVYTLHPDRPDLLEDTFFCYALEANLDLSVNPDNLLEVQSVNVGLGLVGRF